MHIDSLLICRANNKVYEKLRISDLNDSGNILAIILDDDQPKNVSIIPTRLYRIEAEGSHSKTVVAVYPIMPVQSGSFIIAEFTQQGEMVSQSEHRVDFESAKWKSRINYRTKQEACNSIRLIDERESEYGDAALKPLTAIGTDSNLLIRLEVTRLLTHHVDNSDRDIVECVDTHGNRVPMRVIQIGASEPDLQSETPYPFASRTYSIFVPWNQGDLFIYTWIDGSPETTIIRTLHQSEYNALLAQSNKFFYQNAYSDSFYAEWFRLHRPAPFELDRQRMASFEDNPLFSIVAPLYNTPLRFFKEMLVSVVSQTYKNWELILVNASSDNAELSNAVCQAQKDDERIRVKILTSNGGISLNTNEGIRIAKGDFVCFLDHDDLLEPNALFEYAQAINQHADTDLLYCDEDKLDTAGVFVNPYFKPDFSIDLLRNNNYICHFLSIRKSLLDKLPPNTAEYDGAQDHNMILNAVEHARHVHHVPKILYHWRISETSTAGNVDDKPYATAAGIKALEEHLRRVGLSATVQKDECPFTYKVLYDVPDGNPLVSIIIPSRDHINLLDECLSSISEVSTYTNFEVIVVESNSINTDTFKYYETMKSRFPATKIEVLTWNHEFNFSKIINFGAQHAHGEYLLLLSNGTQVRTPNWIEAMLGIASRADVGAVGPKLYYPDDTLQHAGIGVGDDRPAPYFTNLPRGNHGYFRFDDIQRNVSAVTAACMMTKRSVFDSVNGFTDAYSLAYSDVDYCLKLRDSGLLITYTPEAELYHYASASRNFDSDETERVRYIQELARIHLDWAEFFAKGDPYYTPNLQRKYPKFCYYQF